ncbi:hypothetical protein TolaII67_03120 [Lactococcus lactis subsp. lactis]
MGNPSLNHRYRKGFYSLFKTLQQNHQSSVTKKTTRLVTGYFPIDLIKGYSPSQKLTEAEQAIESGQPLIIMSEKEFVDFLAQFFQLLAKGL